MTLHDIHVCDVFLFSSIDTGEGVSVGVVDAFIELSRELRQLKDLPLDIATVKGASPIFCHTEVIIIET